MAKKRRAKSTASTPEPSKQVSRQRLPDELEARLRTVWAKIGHLVEWCDRAASWTALFYTEPRPYREVFYWESVARMVGDYLAEHPAASPERALTDCLIATQSAACPDDPAMMVHFRKAWREHLHRSRKEIETFIEADLALAAEEKTLETVARLYAADHQRWKLENGPCA